MDLEAEPRKEHNTDFPALTLLVRLELCLSRYIRLIQPIFASVPQPLDILTVPQTLAQ